MFNFFIYTFCNLWCGDRARDGDIGYNFNDEIPQPTDDNQPTEKKLIDYELFSLLVSV